MCPKCIGYPEAVDNTHAHARTHARTHAHTHAHNKCLCCCLQQNASGVYPEDGQGPSSTRGYGEGHPGSERRDASAKGSENVQHCTYYPEQQYLVKAKKDSTAKLEPNYKHSQIFNQEQETSLANYLEKCSCMFHGLTTKNVRTLAYEMAFLNRIEMPATWTEKQIAGREWLFGFLRRHETLAIRQPEATSLARETAFNRATVGAFFDILHDCLEKIGASGDRIVNLDETGVTTVKKSPKGSCDQRLETSWPNYIKITWGTCDRVCHSFCIWTNTATSVCVPA